MSHEGNNKNSSEVSEEPIPKRHKTSSSPSVKTSSGFDVGLRSSDKVHKDIERSKKDEKDLVNKMDPSSSGRGAATIYRDNVGTYALINFLSNIAT